MHSLWSLPLWLSIVLACSASGERAESRQITGPDRYAQIVSLGDAAFDMKDYSGAARYYEDASRIRLFESPNYEVLVKLAAAYCKQGQTRRGESLLTDFSCMLDVQLGKRKCFGEAPIGYLGERNKELSDLCFERMCSEMYLGYYESPPASVAMRVDALRTTAEEVRATCTSK